MSSRKSSNIFILLVILTGVTVLSGCAVSPMSGKGNRPESSVSDDRMILAQLSAPKKLAMVIGINEFRDAEWNTLKYAVKDANDFTTVLNDVNYGHFDEVTTLISSRETTRENIINAIDNLSNQNISADDTVILYISSHGTIARTVDGVIHQYVVVNDTNMNNIEQTAIDLDILRGKFGKLKSRKKVMIFAFCHSGKGKSRLDDSLMTELKKIKAPFFVKPIEKASEATIILSASSWGETAYEDNRLQNDIYTHFLIEGIKKHDRDTDGAVTVTEAHDYAREQTYYLTKGEQRPSIESFILGADPVLLAGEIVREGKPVLYDYSRRYENKVIFVDGNKKGTLPMGIAVEPGTHRIELRNNDGSYSIYKETVSMTEGQQIALPIIFDGYAQGTTLTVGYQEFVSAKVDNSIVKPMLMLGVAYSNRSYFGPDLGYRFDFSYGKEEQVLDIGSLPISAEVAQTSIGASLLYRKIIGGVALYSGARVGGLDISRDITGTPVSENNFSPTIGGIIGLNYKYKKQLSLSVESTFNYAEINMLDINTSSYYYNVFGGLSVNF